MIVVCSIRESGDLLKLFDVVILASAALSLAIQADYVQASPYMAGVASASGQVHVGIIESPRTVHLYSGNRSRRLSFDQDRLVAGARMHLAEIPHGEGKILRLLTVDRHGRFLISKIPLDVDAVLQAETITWKSDPGLFPFGSDFGVMRRGAVEVIFAANQKGELLELNLTTGEIQVVEVRDEVILPGSSVSSLHGTSNEIFLVDRRGSLVSYLRDPIRRWSGPNLIGSNFLPGSRVVVWIRPDGAREHYVAAVNRLGELRLARHDADGWRMDIAPGWLLPPGTALDVFHSPVNIRILGVNAVGTLKVMHLVNTEWRERFVGHGFDRFSAPFLIEPSGNTYAIDPAGDLMNITISNDIWSAVLVPAEGGPETGPVIRRVVNPSKSGLAVVQFRNPSAHRVTLRRHDADQPGRPVDLVLPAGAKLSMEVERPSTAIIRSRLLTSAPTAFDVEIADIERTQDVRMDDPLEFEVLHQGAPLSYQDSRLHRTSQTSGEFVEISEGLFRLPINRDGLSLGTKSIDVIQSARSRTAIVAE